MKAALLFAPKFKDKDEVKRILELRGWSIVERSPDCVITIGGDGSILYAESKYPGKPILSLNCGELGFLASNEIDAIEEVLMGVETGKYHIDKREKLEFSVGKHRGSALNEVLIASTVAGKALRLNIQIDKEDLGFFVCDGVLVSTPTGSTGYNFSCGGPIIEPGTAAFAVTLVNPHLSKLKSIVLAGTHTVAVSFSRQNPGITVVADGLENVKISHSDTIKIKKSKKTAKLIKLTDNYFSNIRDAFT